MIYLGGIQLISISLCVVTKNQKDALESCLLSVNDIVDEIIIVEGSTDKKNEIARKFTDKIYNFENIDDFSTKESFLFSKATKEYILLMDANDFLGEEDRRKLEGLKESLKGSVDAVSMKYNTGFDDDGNVICSHRENRLAKRTCDFKWEGIGHGQLTVKGNTIDSDICISKGGLKINTDHNLKTYQRIIESGEELGLVDIFYYAKELYDNKQFEEALVNYERVLNSEDCGIEYKIYACGRVADYYSSIGNREDAVIYCLRSFEYAAPRAEFCCRLGTYYLIENKLKEAIFWFELATSLEKPENSWGFFNDSCWTWIPYMYLSMCHTRLEDYELAYKYNDYASSYVPKNENMLKNKKILKQLMANKNTPTLKSTVKLDVAYPQKNNYEG